MDRKGNLTKISLKSIEQKINLFRLPTGIGRIPSDISSVYGSFTADQWRNWITIYSPIVLKDVIPPDHLRCWLLFVHGCVTISLNTVTLNVLTHVFTTFVSSIKYYMEI